MANESTTPSPEQKKEIKKQVRKETKRFKRKTLGTLGILALIVGIVILLLAGKGIGLFGNGSGFGLGDSINKLKGDIGDAIDGKDSDDKDSVEASNEQTDIDETQTSAPDDQNASTDGTEGGDNAASVSDEQTGGEAVMEVTISGNQIIYNGTTYDSCDAFKEVVAAIDHEENEDFYIIGETAIKKTYDEVYAALEELKLTPVYRESEETE